MLQIERVQDIEVLRQATLLLDRENRQLHQRLRELCEKLATLEGRDASQLEIELLRELERLRPKPIPPTPPAVDQDSPQGRSAAAQSGHGPRSQPRLPIEVVVSELLEGHRACPQCGLEMEPLGGESEDSDEITVVERQFVLRHHRRVKYRCRCNGAVVTAPGPEKLTPGGRYSVEFAVEVAVDKYLDHLPLERQARRMEREGLAIDSQTATEQQRYLNDKILASFELFLKLGAAVLAGAAWLKAQELPASKQFDLGAIVSSLIAIIGLCCIGLIVMNLFSWLGYRKAEWELLGKPEGLKPTLLSCSGEIILTVLIGAAIALSCHFLPVWLD